jgi:hypothetical protein
MSSKNGYHEHEEYKSSRLPLSRRNSLAFDHQVKDIKTFRSTLTLGPDIS